MATILSVVTPIFNGERFVERCYASLKAQTFADWEWVVVDDGSTDGTAKALGGIHDCRLRIVRLPHNEGRGSARARALNEARGDWMVVWDVDDLNYPDRLARVNSARLEGYDFCCSYAVVVDNALRMKGVRGFEPAFRVLPRYFVHPTLACRTDLARDIGYDPALRAGEDLTLMLTLARRYRGQFIDEALMIYQEDREVNLDKAIASNESQLLQVRRLYRSGVLDRNLWSYVATAMRWRTKLLLLKGMRLYPSVYLRTVPLRSYGQTTPGWSLSSDRTEFLRALQQEYRSGTAPS